MSGQPNVLFVFADQLRAAATGYMGNTQVRTPNLDALAEQGVSFTNAYASNPLCGPARASILTGCYPHTNRLVQNHLRLPTDNRTLAHCFRRAGYETGYIGKWHLDGDGKPGRVPAGDRRLGFDFWKGFNRGHAHHEGHPSFAETGEVHWDEGYQPDVQTDYAIDFLDRHRSDPFCLFVSWGPPHPPFDAPDEYRSMYDADSLSLRPNVPDDSVESARNDLVDYYGMITSLDENVGRLVDALSELGVADDTILCFTSDHGEMLGSHGLYGKRVPYEESVHVPLIMRYPDGMPTGRSMDGFVNLVDYMPTLLSFCDIPVPDRVQGQDLSRYITGSEADKPTETFIEGDEKLFGDDPWRGLRTERFLVTVDEDLQTRHLFDMRTDPYQERNLAGDPDMTDVESELRRRLIDRIYELDDRYLIARHIHQTGPESAESSAQIPETPPDQAYYE